MAVFRCFFLGKQVFLAKRATFTYSTSYIFWKLLFQRLILAINEDFLSIPRVVRILLTHCNRIEHKIWHLVMRVTLQSNDTGFNKIAKTAATRLTWSGLKNGHLVFVMHFRHKKSRQCSVDTKISASIFVVPSQTIALASDIEPRHLRL